MARARAWSGLYVGPRCSVQTSVDRFGPDAHKAIRAVLDKPPSNFLSDDWLDDEDDDPDDSESDEGGLAWPPNTAAAVEGPNSADDVQDASSPEPHEFPRVARLRMNLTVLSQQYDLYFVAYRDAIHVYRPSAGPEILKHQPELVLQPTASPTGRQTRGHIDRRKPHQVNHLIVGELGDSEILLLCYDDGDVIAYYTHCIATYTGDGTWSSPPRPSSPPRVPKPFFHESVGISAWGLAVHKQSRLIAVSSNMHEVTVFAFALRPVRPAGPSTAADRRGFPAVDSSPKTNAGLSAMELERHLRRRDRYWRIILPVSEFGNNIPNIAFWDDDQGNAEKVVAVDLNGFCWLLDIWKVGSHPVNIIVPAANFRHNGWGVLVLPTSFFLPTETLSEALGLPASSCAVHPRTGGGSYVNISRSLTTIQGNPVPDMTGDPLMEGPRPPPPVAGALPMPGAMRAGAVETLHDISVGDASGSESSGSEADLDEDLAERWRAVQPPELNRSLGGVIDLAQEEEERFRRPLSICPSLALTDKFAGGLNQSAAHTRRSKTVVHNLTVARDAGSVQASAASRLAILRTFEVSVELFTTDPRDASVVCHNLLSLRHLRPHVSASAAVWDMPLAQRMSMLHPIPELGAVLLGSLSGRVALLRLTRPPSPASARPRVRRAFRVEWVLPRADDERRGLRPHYCLLGMAVSPQPQSGLEGLRLTRPAARDTGLYPKRWRIMLHYTEHTILQYTLELTDPGSGDLTLRPL